MAESTKGRFLVIVLASQKGRRRTRRPWPRTSPLLPRQQAQGPAVLIDTDPQGSLSAWWNERQVG